MKMLTVSLLVCAMMAMTRAAAVPEAEPGHKTGPLIQKGKSAIVKQSTSCPSGWTGYDGRCFFYISTPMTWADAEEGTWFWSDGRPFTFHYWDAGQPDNHANAHCLLMNFGGHKKFDDQPCHYRMPFVCAKKA